MLDPETTLDTVGKASEAVTKFQEIIQKVFGPRWTKKQADADAYADERKLQTIRENPDMEIVYTKDGMLARARTHESLLYRAEQRMLNDAIRQENNLESILEIAATEVKLITESNSTPIDDDWITRFFSIARDINSDDMQYVWGKILAGEIAQPGKFSMRTLETIRNISKSEAEIFQKILPLIIGWGRNRFIGYDDEINKNYGVHFSDLLLLGECGLLEINSVAFKPMLKKDDSRYMYTNNRVAIISGVTEEFSDVSIYTYKLTTAGRELFEILECEPNTSYFENICEYIFKENMGKVNISVHEVNSKTQEDIQYNEIALRVFETIDE